MNHNKNKTGFTLIEALFAAMLIGLVIAAIAVSSGAATMTNGAGIDISTAEFLIEEIREHTSTISFVGVRGYNNMAYNPPIDISGATIPELDGFTQQIKVDYVQPSNLSQVSGSATDFVRVTVTITKNNRPISAASWIRANLD